MKAFIRWFFRVFFCKIFYRVNYINKENEENLDKCMICPNHSNTLEPTWIYAKTPNLSIMAKAELFKVKIWGKILTYFGVFPIRRGEKDIKSLLHAIHVLKNNDKQRLLIFPEGERQSVNEKRGTAKVGSAYIAYKAGVPIVPVYITKNAKLFSKVNIIYGKPMYITKEIAENKEEIQKFSDKLLDTIYELKDTVK